MDRNPPTREPTPFDHLEPMRCGACGDEEREGDAPHRRGRCRRCYEKWVRERPIGLGAFCTSCGERRVSALRYFELRRIWVVLCHSCSARAEALDPQPFSIAGLRLRLHRERRRGDRRSVGAKKNVLSGERREGDRRLSERNLLDVTEFAELVVELDAEFADPRDDAASDEGPITGVHRLADLSEAKG
jgi:hypothetical protein